MNYARLLQSVKAHEGFRDYPYDDATGQPVHAPQGNLTVGYGWNLDARPLPETVCSQLLSIAVADSLVVARRFAGDWWDELGDVRQEVLVEMAYQLGGRLMQFANFRTALRAGDHVQAVAEMLDSKWAREFSRRANGLAERWRTA